MSSNGDSITRADAFPVTNARRAYISAGYSLLPLKGQTKLPRDKGWTKRRYSSEVVLQRATETGDNVGIRLADDDLVIDVDPRNGGAESFKHFCAEYGFDPKAWPRVRTGGGGDHFFLKKPPDFRIRLALPDYPGLEFKTVGQQVVAAGSIHPDTKRRYRWQIEHPQLGKRAPDAPGELLAAIRRPDTSSVAHKGGEYTADQIAGILARLKPEDFREEAKWRSMMMACHHASGGTADEEFIAWSTSDPNYADDAEIIRTRWDSLDPGKADAITAGTLRHFAIEAGAGDVLPPDISAKEDFDEFEEDERSGITPIESRGLKVKGNTSKAEDTYTNAIIAVRASGLEPAFNDLAQSVTFRNPQWDVGSGDVLNDHTLRIVRLFLANKFQGNAYEASEKNVYDALMAVAYSNKFNPVLDYLDGLEWDGQNRLDRLFVNYFACDDSEYTRAVSRCFAIGAVRRMRQPGCKLDTMPVIKGPQGWGKSMGVQALFGRQWFTDADMGNLKDKDAALKLRGMWCVEFAEIDSLTKAATGDLKAFISRAIDRQRDPYDRLIADHPRRCVFAGTVNEGGYLKDSTGARRFWPLELLDRVDVARIEADRDQLWAEAATLEAAGESHVLPQKLWSVAAEAQAEQTTDDPWADELRAFLSERERAWEAGEFEAFDDPADEPKPPDRVHTSELFDALSIPKERRTKNRAQLLRTVMESALGWKHQKNVHIGTDQGKGYVRIAYPCA